MPVVKIREVHASFFTQYSENNYYNSTEKNLLEHGNNQNFFASNEELGNIKLIQPYKLHISIHPDSYSSEIIKALNECLLYAIAEGIIPEFKHISYEDYVKLQENKVIAENNLNMLSSVSKYFDPNYPYCVSEDIRSDSSLNEQWIKFKLENYIHHGRHHDYCDSGFIERMKVKSKGIVTDAQRFLNNSQYTIYLPIDLDKGKIAILINKLDRLLSENLVSPGDLPTELLDAEPKINKYISLRQDYINGQYLSVSECIKASKTEPGQLKQIFDDIYNQNELLTFLNNSNFSEIKQISENVHNYFVKKSEDGNDPFLLDYERFKAIVDKYTTHHLFFALFKPEMKALEQLVKDHANKKLSFSSEEVRSSLQQTQSFRGSKEIRLTIFDNPNHIVADNTGTTKVIRELGKMFNS